MDLLAKLASSPIVPVLTVDDAAKAGDLARALADNGLTNLEVTLRTPAALDVIAEMKKAVPSANVGAGTVLTEQDVANCKAVGADFLVTPGSSPKLRTALLSCGIDVMVGVATVSEVLSRLEEGFEYLKFFPAEQVGGAAALKSMGGPIPHARFCPTGGITPEKIKDYLTLPNIIAVGGTWIATREMVAAGNWAKVAENARLATSIAETHRPQVKQ